MPINEDIKWNESGGRLFEFLSVEMLSIVFPDAMIEWQPKGLDTVIIQPDIAIYNSNHELLALGLSGHATTKNSAGMKVDRSVEELFEIKESLPETVQVFSIIWHSPNGWSAGHLKRMDEAFDYNFVVFRECVDIWNTIVPEINVLAARIKGADEKTSIRLVKESSIPRKIAKHFGGLQRVVFGGKERNHELWESIRQRYRHHKTIENEINSRPYSRIKEALIPLMWLPIEGVKSAIEGKTIEKNDKSNTFIRLGGAIQATNGIKVNASISSLSIAYDKSIILETIQGLQTAEGINTLLDSLESSERMNSRIFRTEEAVKRRTLFTLCEHAFDPTDVDYTGKCWPLEVITAWIKYRIDGKFGLVEAQREAIGDTRTNYGWDPIIYYAEGNIDALDDESIKRICSVLEDKVQQAKSISVEELSANILREARKEKNNNPLQWIIRKTLDHNGVEYSRGLSIQEVFARQAGLAASSGRTTFQLKIDTENECYIIHALSAYSTTHKDVEFSAKARQFFLLYPNNYKMVYVVDGTNWPERTIRMFNRAGAEVVLADHFEKWVRENFAKLE